MIYQLKMLHFEYPFYRYLLYHTLCQTPIKDIKELVKLFCHAYLTTKDVQAWQYHVHRYVDDVEIINALREGEKLSKNLLSKAVKKYDLMDMWKFKPDEDSDMHIAFKIALSNESLALNILSLKGVRIKEIVKLYGSYYHAIKSISIDITKIYLHYFWDLSNMNSADWSHLLPKLENERFYHLAKGGDLDFVKWSMGLPCEETDTLKLIQKNLKYLSYLLGTEGWSRDYGETLDLFLKHNRLPPVKPNFMREAEGIIPGTPPSEVPEIEDRSDLDVQY